ncbi:MAG: acetylglutamate kinase [Candidatus Methanomethylophilus sp.]|nr:acetylglutamate kinase [Methanomethylophilus sp.]
MRNVYLIKFGGNALDGKGGMRQLAHEVADLVREGYSIVLVHGGGPEISAEMERLGMKPMKVAGVRITDEAGLEVAEKVLKKINADLVDCLLDAGAIAVGMPGYFCTECERKKPYKAVENGKELTVDPGLVGEVVSVDKQTIFDLLDQHIVPVVYPIGAEVVGDKMQHLNVNADTMAAGIAAGVECKEMIAITDVPGILENVHDLSSKIDRVTFKEIDQLLADGTISGGMVPKVEACRKAVLAGAEAVRMVNGRDPESIVKDVIMGAPKGTLIVKE